MGADLSRIRLAKDLVIVRRPGKPAAVSPVNLAERGYWHAVLDRLPETKILVIDPLPAYLGRGVNDRQNQEVQQRLQPFLKEVIQPRGICLIAITHLSKSPDARNAAQRITGSIAYTNIPRNVHMVWRDEEDPTKRFFHQIKCNNAPDGVEAIAFRVHQLMTPGDDGQIETCGVAYLGTTSVVDMRSMFESRGRRGPEPVKATVLAEWIWKTLSAGPMRLAWIIDQAKEERMLPPGEHGTGALYRAMRRIPALHEGWIIDQFEASEEGGKARKYWQLLESSGEGKAAPPARAPF